MLKIPTIPQILNIENYINIPDQYFKFNSKYQKCEKYQNKHNVRILRRVLRMIPEDTIK